MTARAPDIAVHEDWLAQHFPQQAGQIVIVTPGAGETPEDVLKAEEKRFPDPAYATKLKKAIREAETSLGFATTVTLGTGPSAHPVTFVHLMTDRTLQHAEDHARLEQLLTNAPDKQAAWLQMIQSYIARQELGHAVDQLTRWKPAAPPPTQTDSFNARDTSLASAQAAMRMEATGEVFSALDLMQREARGELNAPARPLLERIKQFHQWSLMGSPRALGQEGGKHLMVDEAIDAALQWGEQNQHVLATLPPAALLRAARGLAGTLTYPTPAQLDDLLHTLTTRPEELRIGSAPGATLASLLDQLTTNASANPWEQQQLREARTALEQLHDPHAPILQDVCWPPETDHGPHTALTTASGAHVSVPTKDGKVLKPQPCASSFPASPASPAKPPAP